MMLTDTFKHFAQWSRHWHARPVLGILGVLGLLTFVSPLHANSVDSIVSRGTSGIKAGADSQKRIDSIADKIDKIDRSFGQESKAVESLKDYNDRMRRTVEAQRLAMQKLERSIEDASLIERQILPLMLTMIDGLERFIQADLPFKQQERQDRVVRIKSYLSNANVSAAERFRQVLSLIHI